MTQILTILTFGIPALILFSVVLNIILIFTWLYRYILVHFITLAREFGELLCNLLDWSIYRDLKIIILEGFSEDDTEKQKNESKYRKYDSTNINLVSKILLIVSLGVLILLGFIVAIILRYILKLIYELSKRIWALLLFPLLHWLGQVLRDCYRIASNLNTWGAIFHLNNFFGFVVEEHEMKNALLRLILVNNEQFRITNERILAQILTILMLAPLYVAYRIPSGMLINFIYYCYYQTLIIYYYAYTKIGFRINKLIHLTVGRYEKISENIDFLYILEIECDQIRPRLEDRISSRSMFIRHALNLSQILFAPFYFFYRLIVIKTFSLLYECLINMFHQRIEIKYLN